MRKISPKDIDLKTIKSEYKFSTTPRITIVGVFNNEFSSSIFFSKGFKNLGIYPVEFDYRDTLKNNYFRTIGIITSLAKETDVMIIQKGNGIPIHAIEMASKYCRIWHWFMDWFPMFKQHRNLLEISQLASYRSATGYATAELWCKKIKLPVYHILDGSDSTVYFPLNIDKEYDITFIGSCDYERKQIYEALKEENFNVKFFGPKFTEFVGPNEFREICSKSKIVLNISRGNYVGYSSLRLWNVLSCGSLVLTKNIPYMKEYLKLKEDEHIVSFSNIKELISQTKYYLENEYEREEIAKNGREFVLNNRTWTHVAKDILQVLTTEKSCFIESENIRRYKPLIKRPIKKNQYVNPVVNLFSKKRLNQ